MAAIKLIDKETDLSKIEKHELDWDVNIRGVEYKCFRIPNYVHAIGGRWGENCYWVCRRDENPTVNNLIEFSGEAIRYSIQINENNYIKSKWGETEVRRSISCYILRNDKEFYSFSTNSTALAWAKAYQLIKSKINEGVINFSSYDYPKKEIIGRHIWWHGKPYTLCTYMEGQCCSMAVAGHREKDFNYYVSGENGVKLDLLEDENISWFCPEY